jgi:hypothetical protein
MRFQPERLSGQYRLDEALHCLVRSSLGSPTMPTAMRHSAAFRGLIRLDRSPALAEFPLPNTDPQVGLRGRLFAFAIGAFALAIFISPYLEIMILMPDGEVAIALDC